MAVQLQNPEPKAVVFARKRHWNADFFGAFVGLLMVFAWFDDLLMVSSSPKVAPSWFRQSGGSTLGLDEAMYYFEAGHPKDVWRQGCVAKDYLRLLNMEYL
jgi:hypothetical protein